MMTIAVVTPYYKEPRPALERCIQSVASQTVACVHYIVADGYSQAWIDEYESEGRLVHLKLARSHRDFGNTPRGLGALLAISEGADAVAFLDADNYFDNDHVEACLDASASEADVDFVAASMRIVLPDGTPVNCSLEKPEQHVDTSCYFLLPGSYSAVAQWILQPKPVTLMADRFFLWSLKEMGLRFTVTQKPTLTYVSTWAVHYQIVGRPIPDDAKQNCKMDPIYDWWEKLTDTQKVHARRHLGISSLNFHRPI